jgi:hypothetical protein
MVYIIVLVMLFIAMFNIIVMFSITVMFYYSNAVFIPVDSGGEFTLVEGVAKEDAVERDGVDEDVGLVTVMEGVEEVKGEGSGFVGFVVEDVAGVVNFAMSVLLFAFVDVVVVEVVGGMAVVVGAKGVAVGVVGVNAEVGAAAVGRDEEEEEEEEEEVEEGIMDG